ncbi:MAG TPA: hypothetical protein VFU98_10900 [Microlunatus sp.]|nr:hypothetical protein [Microlunatus sp.]
MSGGRLAELLPIGAALALVALMTLTAPDWNADPPRDLTALAVGERGELRDLAVTVRSVDLTSSITLREGTLASTGVFVVVGVEADALIDPVAFQRVRLVVRSGERYHPREEWPAASPPITQAGFTSRGSWVFEIPRAGIQGAHLQVGNDPREFEGYDRALWVDLELDPRSLQPGPVTLDDATTRVTG